MAGCAAQNIAGLRANVYPGEHVYGPSGEPGISYGATFNPALEPDTLIIVARGGVPIFAKIKSDLSLTEVVAEGDAVVISRGQCHEVDPPTVVHTPTLLRPQR
jgi:hypothetical protein